jgi:hypothetical protein
MSTSRRLWSNRFLLSQVSKGAELRNNTHPPAEVLMLKILSFILVTLLTTVVLSAQSNPETEKDQAAIKQAALDYAEGFYEGSGERMERAVHPLLFKRGLVTANPQGDPFLVFMNSETLIEAARSGVGKLDADKRNISVEVLDVNQNTATAKVFTVQFNDYLHLAKFDGHWRIVNVLWRPPAQVPAANAEKERGELGKALTDIRDAANAKDANRMQHFIHPELIRRTAVAARSNGKMTLQDVTGETVLQIVRMGRYLPAKDQPQPEMAILDMYENLASVKSSTPALTEYMHFAKQNGEWRIVNILRTNPQPPAPPKN